MSADASRFVIPPPPQAAVAIAGSDQLFPVRRIWCVGRNYLEHIKAASANDLIWGYGVGIDLTRRDLQIASRDIKRPWEIGKAFDASAPCGPLKAAAEIGHPKKGKITLKCNGK